MFSIAADAGPSSAESDGVRVFFTTRLQNAALILQQKPCGELTPGCFAHNGIGFQRNYPYLVLLPTFHRDWRVSEHDASGSYRAFSVYLCLHLETLATLLAEAGATGVSQGDF